MLPTVKLLSLRKKYKFGRTGCAKFSHRHDGAALAAAYFHHADEKISFFLVFRHLFIFLGEELKSKAQPKVVAAKGGRVVETTRHTAVPGAVVPAATT